MNDMQMSNYYAYGQQIPQSEIDALVACGVNPEDTTNDFLEAYYFWEYKDTLND